MLTRAGWIEDLRAAVHHEDDEVEGDVEVVGVAVAGDTATAGTPDLVSAVVAQLQRAADQGSGVALVQGHLVADEVSLTPLVDGQGGTTVLAASSPGDTGSSEAPGATAIRTLRGRVVAAASPTHTLTAPTEHGLGALTVAAAAVGEAAGLLSELASSQERGVPGAAHARGTQEVSGAHYPDIAAWLLVALVRGGITVTARPPARVGVAVLADTPQRSLAAGERLAGLDVDRIRLQESVKREDGFFTTFLVSTWSPLLVRAARHLGISPDVVTWASMLLGVLAAAAFAVGATAWSAVGALLLYLAFVLDCVDGQLARVTRRFSARGAWLDAMFDRGKEYVVYAGLAVGAVRAGDEPGVWLLAGVALALQTVRHLLDLGYAAQQAADVERLVRRDLADPTDPGPSFWEVGHAQTPPAATAAAAPGFARRVILALRRAEGVTVLKWAKRIVVLPIGERFALIGVLAIATTPRVLFTVLLVWGGLATAYTVGGRVVRSLA